MALIIGASLAGCGGDPTAESQGPSASAPPRSSARVEARDLHATLRQDLFAARTLIESWAVERGSYNGLSGRVLYEKAMRPTDRPWGGDVTIQVAGTPSRTGKGEAVRKAPGRAPTDRTYCLIAFHAHLGGAAGEPADRFTIRRAPTGGWAEPQPASTHPCP